MSEPEKRHRAGTIVELRDAGMLVADLPRDARGRPRHALVVTDSAGVIRAYLNLCKHLPVPLAVFPRDAISEERDALRCLTHGALYALEDGRCFEGPCVGDRLDALRVECHDDEIFILDE